MTFHCGRLSRRVAQECPSISTSAVCANPGETGVAVHLAEDPLRCVAVGSGRYLEELGLSGRTPSPV
jgi:hypothetical protein